MKPFVLGLLCLLLILPSAQPALGAASPLEEIAPLTHWRVGFMLNTPPSLDNLANLPASAAVRLGSSLPSADHYFVLPISTLIQVDEVRLLLFDRSGNYVGDYLASVEVHSLSAGYLRTLSSSSLNLESAANNSWISIPLNDNRILGGDEVIVLHVHRSAAPGGNLLLSLGLDVSLKNLTTFFPIISR